MKNFRVVIKKTKDLAKVKYIPKVNYSVEAPRTRSVYVSPPKEFVKGLAVEVRQNLKENVLKALDSKDDALLKKKLNLVGVKGSCRLNVASEEILAQINGENVLQVLKSELEDPWEYYWTKICKNGNSPDKWYNSLKELKNNPAASCECMKQMMINGVFPEKRHYHVVLDTLAEHLDTWHFSVEWDRFNRRSDTHDSPNGETYNILLKMLVLRNDFNIGLSVIDFMKKKKWTPNPEYVKACEEGYKSITEDEVKNYFKTGNLPKVYAEGKKKEDDARKYYDENVSKWLTQPPLEKLQ